jgi:cytochrome c
MTDAAHSARAVDGRHREPFRDERRPCAIPRSRRSGAHHRGRTGGFDHSIIRWSIAAGAARQVLRFHDDAVNAIAFIDEQRFASAGADGRIALWTKGNDTPTRVLTGHTGSVVALAVSPDRRSLASASWDGTVRLWPLGDGAPKVFQGHAGNVNGVAFTADGASVVSAGYDGTIRRWPATGAGEPVTFSVSVPLNCVATLPGGSIWIGGVDGTIRRLNRPGDRESDLNVASAPILAIAGAVGSSTVVVTTISGQLIVADANGGIRKRVSADLPLWSVAFAHDDLFLVGDGAGAIRRFGVAEGNFQETSDARDDPLQRYAGDRGAEVFRACTACHALDEKAGDRAGPSLHGVFGRRIATRPGYNFSPALKQLNIIWTPETVAKLFEVGPADYTPGTKMPEQRITDPADREALVEFLLRATRDK